MTVRCDRRRNDVLDKYVDMEYPLRMHLRFDLLTRGFAAEFRDLMPGINFEEKNGPS